MPQTDKLPIVVIACQVFQDLLARHLPPGVAKEIIFMDYGLHRVPRNLHSSVQEAIDRIEEPSLVLLGYGLCGNGLNHIKAGRHTLIVSRADDCIAIFLGSYQAYRREFDASPGTYFLTKGWLESGSNPLKEAREYEAKYDLETARWLMDTQYQHYQRLVLVAHSQSDLEAYRPQAEEVARYCERWGMRYEEILGSDSYIRRLVEAAMRLDQAGEDFLVIPPGGEIRQDQFMR